MELGDVLLKLDLCLVDRGQLALGGELGLQARVLVAQYALRRIVSLEPIRSLVVLESIPPDQLSRASRPFLYIRNKTLFC